MPTVLMLAGSPSAVSRSSAVLQYVHAQLTHDFITVESLHVRRLDASELLWANSKGATIEPALAQVERADGIVLACPTYKAAYSGILKTFLRPPPPTRFSKQGDPPDYDGWLCNAHVGDRLRA
ncbi:MAG UNVERIFIED_CONTAM: NAD(P)H-dependent oxidoreductase [Anaerolineae bacterium]|jgi:FMN reductase